MFRLSSAAVGTLGLGRRGDRFRRGRCRDLPDRLVGEESITRFRGLEGRWTVVDAVERDHATGRCRAGHELRLGVGHATALVDLGEGGGDAFVMGVERLGHHHEVGRFLGITLVESLAGLGEELAHLGFHLGGLLDLAQQLPPLLVTGKVEEHLFHLFLCRREFAVVEILHRFHQKAVDGFGGRRLELGDDLREVDLRGA